MTQLDAIDRIEQVELRQPALADLVNQRDQLKARLNQLQTQLDSLQVSTTGSISNVSLSSPATEAIVVGGLGQVKLGIVGAVLGFMAGVALAYVMELTKPTVTDVDEVADILGLPVIAEIPDFKYEHLRGSLPTLDVPTSYVAEAFRMAGAGVAMGMREAHGNLIGVVSAGVGDGKTTTAINLAVALAQTQRSVLALDADLEGQVMSYLLQKRSDAAPEWRGMLDVITRQANLPDATQPILTEPDTRLDLLTAGSDVQRLRGIFDSVEAEELFAELRAAYDVVVVDVPPLLNVSYAAQLLRQVDGVVIVAAAGSSPRLLAELRDRLSFVGAYLVGIAYNRGPLRPERTASIAAIHHDLGGKRTNRLAWAKRRLKRQSADRRRSGDPRPTERV